MMSLSINQQALKQVRSYRCKAQLCYLEGKRDYFLPCEEILGNHCAAMFEKDLGKMSILQAVKKHAQRCPKGKTSGIQGLLGGLILLSGVHLGNYIPAELCIPFRDLCH
jgi:hypothetical protein